MASTLPLFDFEKSVETNRLQREREALSNRIQNLRPNSHKRVELEFRLRELTMRQITIESGFSANERSS
jgi:hypothetical protein